MTTPLPKGQLRHWMFEGVAAHAFHKLAAASLGCDYGFTYTTAAARFCKPANGTLVEHDGEHLVDVVFEHVFEMRLFGRIGDLHWVREGATGRLVVTSERGAAENSDAEQACAAAMEPGNLARFGLPGAQPDERSDPWRPVRWRDNTYLLWGESMDQGASKAPGWTKLVTARIGTLWVPFKLEETGKRLVLEAREYFETLDKCDGNVVFAGERLVGLREARDADSKFQRNV